MALGLYAGICVSDYQTALPWYERLLGSEPSFLPHATEAVWELAEERYVYIEEDPRRAGRARQTLFVDDLDSVMSEIAARGIEPADVETYSARGSGRCSPTTSAGRTSRPLRRRPRTPPRRPGVANEAAARTLKQTLSPPDFGGKTLGDILDDPAAAAPITSFETVDPTATVGDLREKLKTKPDCKDIFVTQGGGRTGKVEGWLTNNYLARAT